MWMLKKRESFSVIGVSVAGGVAHNIGQLIIAIIVVESMNLMYYIPVLLIAGLLTGLVIGLVSHEMLKRLTNIRLQ